MKLHSFMIENSRISILIFCTHELIQIKFSSAIQTICSQMIFEGPEQIFEILEIQLVGSLTNSKSNLDLKNSDQKYARYEKFPTQINL
jgi:hypothetical protein